MPTRQCSEASSVRVAAAYIPHHQLHAFYSLDGSLPQLADLAQALTVRPPQFLLLAAGEEAGYALRGRLQSVIPPACSAKVVANLI
ncbi:Lon N-terminal domain-containing protein [Haematococcus lacustris]|uniref:Lon N-terminal domain-containing protein n=1 Tax=Haematococcus lacustris TaxID=44745 RepID=A0A6A0AGQ4_HAELA|nr:Lon N-terminal domain-containing protein [Haematococcus lacustris]